METILIPERASSAQMIAAQEVEDFDSLVRQHRPRIFRYILASLRDDDAAETLTQDCFVRAYRARASFRGDASASTWLMKIAVNLVRSHVSGSRWKFWRQAERTGVDASQAGDWLADRRGSPEAAAAARQQVAAVWRAAESLSERQRTVFLLRFVEDMDLLEIVAATGMKESTVKTHLFRAVEAVRAKVAVAARVNERGNEDVAS
jgi:RNA polymerase sigma-70 factor (ECF subfamily)